MKKSKPTVLEQIDALPMPSVLIECFDRYAKTVILDRAIPDARDGLKPVQRRIIYTMWEENNIHTRPTIKCARTVGNVIGKYHPHGDSSVYDAMVRLSQDWKMSIPLLEFQGNNGSIDNDPAAAYRYTESRLTEMASYLVSDIDKDTVDMTLNFDDTEKEPLVLPARFPNLLVNGANGIAVGAATNIPPHNLTEVIDATIYRLEHKRTTVSDLRQFILGPDFPTGGILDDPKALDDLYETGQASFFVHATVDPNIEKNRIVITNIPYGEVKSTFVADLDKRQIDGKLDAVSEIRDESTDVVRVVIDLKKDADPTPVINYFRNKGAFRTTFSANMLAIDKGHPKTMNLLEMIDAYIDHQKEVITRRTNYDLKKKTWRLHIVEGLIKAISILDEVIALIRASKGKEDAKNQLIETYSFTTEQAEAIVTLQLYRLSNTDVTILQEEERNLSELISEYQAILGSEDKLIRLLVNDLKAIRKSHDTPRKTLILQEKIKAEAVDQRSLIAKEQVIVVLTHDGYIKRTSVRSYEASLSAKNSDPLPKIKVSDYVIVSAEASTHDAILFFTSSGNYFYVPIHEIPEAKWKEEGRHLNNIVNLSSEEKVVSGFVVSGFYKGLNIALLTADGKLKRVTLEDFAQQKLTSRGLRAMPLQLKDTLVSASLTHGNSDVIVINDSGAASRFNENDIPIVSTKASGVKAMNFGKDGGSMAAMLTLTADEHCKMLILSNTGAARVIMSTNIPTYQRLGAKTSLVKVFKSSPMKIVSVTKLQKGEAGKIILVSTNSQNIPVDIEKLDVASLGAGMKNNLAIGKDKVLGRSENGTIINSSTKIEEAPVYVKPLKVEDDAGIVQLSLFDKEEE